MGLWKVRTSVTETGTYKCEDVTRKKLTVTGRYTCVALAGMYKCVAETYMYN